LTSTAVRSSPHVWSILPAPWRGADFSAQARQRGVALTPAEAFTVGRSETPHAVRICLGTPQTRRRVEAGLRILAEILAGVPRACGSLV